MGKHIDVAGQLKRRSTAKLLELLVVIGLARFWAQQRYESRSPAAVIEIYHWFTEGFDTKDLQEAKALLQELT